MGYLPIYRGGKRLFSILSIIVITLLAPSSEALAIPPPELVRIGSIFVQSLAVILVFLSPVFFFLRRHIGKMFAAMKRAKRWFTVLFAVGLVLMAAYGISFLWVNQLNTKVLAVEQTPRKAVVFDGSLIPADSQFAITDSALALPPHQAADCMENSSCLIIDIREPVEFATRHIQGTINIRLGDLMAGGEYRQLDPNKRIILVCEVGERGSAVAATLRSKGIQAQYVDKGIRGWIDNKLPIVGNLAMQLPDFKNKYKQLSPKEFRTFEHPGSIVLIDVRTRTEFSQVHINGAINLPLVNLPTADVDAIIQSIPNDKEVIGIAYDRFGAYYCLIVGFMLNQNEKRYGGTLVMTATEQ